MMNELEQSQRKRKPRRTEEEKITLCKQWQSSGLSRSDFCRRQGLTIATFCHWLKTFAIKSKNKNKKLEEATVEKMPFLPLSTLASQQEEMKLEIQLPNGLICRFSSMTETQKIKEIIAGLQHVTSHC